MPKPVVFVTHVGTEKALAKILTDQIAHDFRHGLELFVASDPVSLPMGDEWFEKLTDKLRRCQLQILLLSPSALLRPWVHFEAGAAWALKKRQLSLCHSGVTPGTLGAPLGRLQAGLLTNGEDLQSMYSELAKVANVDIPGIDFDALGTTLQEAVDELPRAAEAVETTSVPPSSTPRAKSHRMLVLASLRELAGEQARNPASPTRLDLDTVVQQGGGSVEAIQETLLDLLTLGYATPSQATVGIRPIDGAVRITAPGMRELERLGEEAQARDQERLKTEKLIDDRIRGADRRKRSARAYSTGMTMNRTSDE